MKRMLGSCLVLGLLLALLAGCGGRSGAENVFSARVLSLNGNSVLVEALEGEGVRTSSDQFSFSREGLAKLDPAPGAVVRLWFDGAIAESYPAQITVTRWELASEGESTSFSQPPALTVTTADQQGVGMRFGYQWTREEADGTAQSVCADSIHPLSGWEDLPVFTTADGAFALAWPEQPDQVTVEYWTRDAWQSEGSTEGTAAAYAEGSVVLPSQDLPCVVAVRAVWQAGTLDRSSGDCLYSFRLERP